MAMALEMDGIIECGVIDLVMWVVALSSKGKWSYDEPPFSKRKEKIIIVFTNKCMDGESFFLNVFPGTIVQNYRGVFTGK